MKTRSATAFVAAFTVIGSSLLLASPASAGSGTSSTSAGQVTFEFPDVVLDGSGLCFDAPLSATATVKPNTQWFVDVTFRQPGTVPLSSSGRVSGNNSGSATGTIQICPSDGVGRMVVDGEFTTLEFDAPYTNAKSPITTEFTISKTPTVVTINKVRQSSAGTAVSGKVTAESAKFGVVTTYGDVIVQYRRGNKGAWKNLGKGYTAKAGFSVTSKTALAKGAQVRVIFKGNEFALPSEVVK